jgi:hypothetical protein
VIRLSEFYKNLNDLKKRAVEMNLAFYVARPYRSYNPFCLSYLNFYLITIYMCSLAYVILICFFFNNINKRTNVSHMLKGHVSLFKSCVVRTHTIQFLGNFCQI